MRVLASTPVMSTTKGASGNPRRRWGLGTTGLLAWLTLVGLLLAPLAPRIARADRGEETEVEFEGGEIEDAFAPASHIVHRQARTAVAPPPATRVRRPMPALAAPRPRPDSGRRPGLPRRVPPDDDPTDSMR
jgi:hypothetical protein